METPVFEGFPHIRRLSHGCIVTEKIDGTNAQVCITEDGQILAGSRTRWITPESDNYGFAVWVQQNKEELMKLGPGRHFGEWWGKGIQRGYGLDGRKFSLFNAGRWSNDRPLCCDVVPVLYHGKFDTSDIDACLSELQRNGSVAAPGFMNPEGIVVFHCQSGTLFKKTLGGDGHKGATKSE